MLIVAIAGLLLIIVYSLTLSEEKDKFLNPQSK